MTHRPSRSHALALKNRLFSQDLDLPAQNNSTLEHTQAQRNHPKPN